MEERELAQIESVLDQKMSLARGVLQLLVMTGVYMKTFDEIVRRLDEMRHRLVPGYEPTIDECLMIFAAQGYYSFESLMAQDIRERIGGDE